MKTLIAKRWFDGTRYRGAEPVTLIIEDDRIVDLIPGIRMTTDEAQICEFDAGIGGGPLPPLPRR